MNTNSEEDANSRWTSAAGPRYILSPRPFRITSRQHVMSETFRWVMQKTIR